ncbi:polyphosphate kinase 2 [Labrys portucalensis]|uniref:ADP/GDP-polyphosphate phosphotransferase n=1 Tax=Labrys neptuniae TaxID=376174 RepID=A0ABV6ZLN5_9HYPH|nr:polyphosphate kinase 2 [Labrys neptuniae]MDT3381824.1 polyphosphate kinase 2 [Labrys neptuniae]
MTKKAGKQTDEALKKAIAGFRLDDLDLPPEIDEAAFRSGNYPHKEKLKSKTYERDLRALQIELLKAQTWVKEQGERVVVVFEGRDTAGKGGAIHRFTQHLSPRDARVVALSKPTPTEQGQWYFQRYVGQLPTKGEIAIFDRSWYNRGGVEPVMGFCTPEQTDKFLHEAPQFEAMLVRDGIRLFKLFLTIGQAMQLKRLHARYADPLKQWKLSPIDHQAVGKWDDYSQAYDRMLAATDTVDTPWTIIKANDKLRTRLAAIRAVLADLPYPDKDEKLVGGQDSKIVLSAEHFLANGGEV